MRTFLKLIANESEIIMKLKHHGMYTTLEQSNL